MIDIPTAICCTILGLIAGIGVGINLAVIVEELIGKDTNN